MEGLCWVDQKVSLIKAESGRGLIGDGQKCYGMFKGAIIDRYEILDESEEAWMMVQEMPTPRSPVVLLFF